MELRWTMQTGLEMKLWNGWRKNGPNQSIIGMEGTEPHCPKIGRMSIDSCMLCKSSVLKNDATGIKRSAWKDGAQRNVPRDPLPWFKPSSGNGLKDIRITQPMNHMNQLLTHGMQETLTGTMIGAHIEGLEL